VQLLLSQSSRCFIAVAAFFALTAVVLGAYASHGLSVWAQAEQVSQVETAVQYQLFHAVSIIIVSLLVSIMPSRWLVVSQYCFTMGILCFSGSLYYLVFAGSKLLVLITPIGGLLLIVAWLMLLIAMLFNSHQK